MCCLDAFYLLNSSIVYRLEHSDGSDVHAIIYCVKQA
jgi:hypothetical protein